MRVAKRPLMENSAEGIIATVERQQPADNMAADPTRSKRLITGAQEKSNTEPASKSRAEIATTGETAKPNAERGEPPHRTRSSNMELPIEDSTPLSAECGMCAQLLQRQAFSPEQWESTMRRCRNCAGYASSVKSPRRISQGEDETRCLLSGLFLSLSTSSLSCRCPLHYLSLGL